MNIALINIPFKDSDGNWISLPPKGYGGIQWYVYHLMEAYLELGHKVWLLGAPGTEIKNQNLTVIPAATPEQITNWLKSNLKKNDICVIHDNSNRVFDLGKIKFEVPVVSSHHFTGSPIKSDYNVFVSFSQRQQSNDTSSLVIRVPVNPNNYSFKEKKQQFFLYMGRVSEWKGVYEAAKFAKKASVKLLIAGPIWEQDYFNKIINKFGDVVEYIGEVGEQKRLKLISEAKAVIVFSISTKGPWGDVWCEPGATVISEAAVSGTPVISTNNGCLKEIVPEVGTIIEEKELNNISTNCCSDIIDLLPDPHQIRQYAIKNWNYHRIGYQYLELFQTITKTNKNKKFYNSLREQLKIVGAIKIPNVFSAKELKNISNITQSMLDNWKRIKGIDKDYWWYEHNKKDVLYRIHNLEKKHKEFLELTQDTKLLEIARNIFGTEYQFFECALVYKAPGYAAEVPWHRDPVNAEMHTIFNFSIFLDFSDEQNGALEIAPGTHMDNNYYEEKETGTITVSANPGDVVIHDVRVFHRSNAITSNRQRRSIVIEYRSKNKI